jgi:hypothetical protein
MGIGIGTVSVVLGILPCIHPPDAAHPLRFDFLLQRVSFPLWGTVLGVIPIAGGAYGIGVRRSRKIFHVVPPIETPKSNQIAARPPNSKAIVKSGVLPEITRTVSQNREEFSFDRYDVCREGYIDPGGTQIETWEGTDSLLEEGSKAWKNSAPKSLQA